MSTVTTANELSSSKIRNLVFLGSTGSGKSSTCNTIYQTKSEPFGPFVVGDEEASCTEKVNTHLSKFKDLNLIDTPGFGNNKVSEEKVEEEFLKDVGSVFSESDERNSKQIDAFVLVVKLTPRAQTLRNDLERVKELFGREAFKSLILLLIYTEGESDSKQGSDFLEKLRKMEAVVKIMREGRSDSLSADWFCVWDNENPRENQEKELLEKIEKLKPYSYSDFMEFKTVSKQGSSVSLKESFERNHEEGTLDNISTMEEVDERAEGSMDSLTRNREYNLTKVLRTIEMRHHVYSQELNESLIQNNEMIEKVIDRVVELEKGAKNIEEHQHFGQLFTDWVCRRRRLKKEEKKELFDSTLKKGAKVAGKEGVKHVATKGGEELAAAAKETAKKAAKDVAKKEAKKGAITLGKKVFCNIF